MSKHTPGPWNYDAGYIDTHRVDDDGSRDYIILAEMHSTFGPDDYGVHQWMLDPVECEANARLIADAPEMYELITKIRSHIDSTCRECEAKAIVPEIDALLDKIEGGLLHPQP